MLKHTLRKLFPNFIRRKRNSTYKIYDPLGIKLLTTLRLGFRHFSEQKFRHNFANSSLPLCSSSWVYTSFFFFLWVPLNENDLLHVTMYVNKNYDNNMNIRTLTHWTTTIKFVKYSERFNQPLFQLLLKPFLFLHPYLF